MKLEHLTFDELNTNDSVHRAIYNIWAECVFNECEESKNVKITIDRLHNSFSIKYDYKENHILDEQGHYYFTDDGHVVIYLDDPKYCQKFIAFERTDDYMEIAYM